ncbi:MAG: 3-methylaspartate ammonia-lyase, partial [Spirochaetaceae bacterium]|nr:3-methylaspartate ammonia-lyase [Spirochaetaceae bacterium]
MKICKILMPVGSMGAGIVQSAFDAGLALKPDAIAMDAGSTDSGPAYLANGMCKYPRAMEKNDLQIAVIGAMTAKIPLFVGSCGTCGTDNMVDECAE